MYLLLRTVSRAFTGQSWSCSGGLKTPTKRFQLRINTFRNLFTNRGLGTVKPSVFSHKWKSNLGNVTQKYATGKLPFEVDARVRNNVLVYSYSKDSLFRVLPLFGVVQLMFWGNIAYFAYTTGSLVSSEEGRKVYNEFSAFGKIIKTMGEHSTEAAGVFLFIGSAIAALSWIYPLHTVRKLYLMKGGESVKMVTYNFLGKERKFKVPLKNISSRQSRERAVSYVSLKVKGRPFHYLLDKRQGVFHEVNLFDYVVGLKRNLKKVK